MRTLRALTPLLGLVALALPPTLLGAGTGPGVGAETPSVASTGGPAAATRTAGAEESAPNPSQTLRVVATLPVYASIARAIGGDLVAVTSIADPNQDAHFVRPKPSFALDLRRADVFITTGLDLELWVPTLLDKAGNADVAEGGEGYVTAYAGIELLDIPASADRSSGDVHIYGNPHLTTDPLRTIQVARNIAQGLESVAPEHAAAFQDGLAEFTDRIHRGLFGDELVELLDGATLEKLALNGSLFGFLEGETYEGEPLLDRLGGWLERAGVFRGERMICYHKNWAYFEERFQVTCADYVESKPGIPPTPRHVARLIGKMRDQEIGVLLAANHFDRGKVESVARRGGAVPVIVPLYPGARDDTEDYFDLVDVWVDELARAFRQANR